MHAEGRGSNQCQTEDNSYLKDGIEQLNEQIGALHNQTNGKAEQVV